MINQATMFLHDFVSHPIMAILNLLDLRRAGQVVHNMTLPDELDGVLVINGDEFALCNPANESNRIGLLFGALHECAKGKVALEQDQSNVWIVYFELKGSQEMVSDESLETAIVMALDILDY